MTIRYVALSEEDRRSLKRTELEQQVLNVRNNLRAIETQHFQASERGEDVGLLEQQHEEAVTALKQAESELAEFSRDGV